jgi:hypothetical protein
VNLVPIIEAVKFHANEWKSALGHRLAENTKRLMLEFRDLLVVSFHFFKYALFLVINMRDTIIQLI